MKHIVKIIFFFKIGLLHAKYVTVWVSSVPAITLWRFASVIVLLNSLPILTNLCFVSLLVIAGISKLIYQIVYLGVLFDCAHFSCPLPRVGMGMICLLPLPFGPWFIAGCWADEHDHDHLPNCEVNCEEGFAIQDSLMI